MARCWQDIFIDKQLRRITVKPYRISETQEKNSTRHLVDSLEEHEILETLLENHKPPCIQKNKRGKLHFLLFTPFRYPPLLGESRFGTKHDHGIYYASLQSETAMAEVAFREFIHRHASAANLRTTIINRTEIQTHIATSRGIRLDHAPFLTYKKLIAHPTSYKETQQLGTYMREVRAEAFCFPSARHSSGTNVGILSPEAFAKNTPLQQRECNMYVSYTLVEFSQHGIKNTPVYAFPLAQFLVRGRLPRLNHAPGTVR